jgi:hypothetical protein
MIYGSATLGDLPVETIVKVYREQLGRRSFRSLGITGRLQRLPERIRRQILEPTCGGCGQRITADVRRVVHDGRTFHPSCGRKFVAAEAANPTAVIGVVRGRACPLGEWGMVYARGDESGSFERFDVAAFDHVDGSRVALQVDHNGAALRGSMTFTPWRGGLDSEFALRDSPCARETLRFLRAGECAGCSVKYVRRAGRWDATNRGDVITRADLREISLIRQSRPAWFGTFAEAR